MARLTCSSLARRLTAAFFAAVILGMSAAFVGDDAGHLRAELPDRPAALPVRGFYMPSYDVVALVDESNEAQLNAVRAQVLSASHAVLAVHVRVPGGTRSGTVATASPRIPGGRIDMPLVVQGLVPKPGSA